MDKEEKIRSEKIRQGKKSCKVTELSDPVKDASRSVGKGDKIRDTSWITDPKIKERLDIIFKKKK